MLNKIILQGNIGRRPEIKLTQQGKEMATFFLATNLPWKVRAHQSGDPEDTQSHTDWHRITVFRASSVSWIKDKLKQGDTVYVEGRLSYNSWQDRYSQIRLTPHIVVEDWQGHVEYLRSSKASFGRHKGQSEGAEAADLDLDPETNVASFMEDPFDGSSDCPSPEFHSSHGFLSPGDQLEGDQPQADQSQDYPSQGDPL
jgi:single-strand DNA-binding protein